jgi:hypothetical protein
MHAWSSQAERNASRADAGSHAQGDKMERGIVNNCYKLERNFFRPIGAFNSDGAYLNQTIISAVSNRA